MSKTNCYANAINVGYSANGSDCFVVDILTNQIAIQWSHVYAQGNPFEVKGYKAF